jgi:hypothetical protein
MLSGMAEKQPQDQSPYHVSQASVETVAIHLWGLGRDYGSSDLVIAGGYFVDKRIFSLRFPGPIRRAVSPGQFSGV